MSEMVGNKMCDLGSPTDAVTSDGVSLEISGEMIILVSKMFT